MSCEKNDEEEEAAKVTGGGEKNEKINKPLEEMIHDELEDIEYFHGNILEEEVKGLLPRKGDFIMRYCTTKYGLRESLLTINWDDVIIDFTLRAKKNNGKTIFTFDSKTKSFSINKYQLTNTKLFHKGKDVMLLNPIAKQAWELRIEDVEKNKKLGEGAFGEVWAGKLKIRMGKTMNVAIKVIKKTTNNEKATTELQKEGSLMMKFSHPNVVRTFGMVIERDTIMVVMELINGGGLNDYVKKNKGTVTMDEKGNYAFDIANGLGDIACRNCLIDIGKKQAKVSDFGLTRETDVYKVQTSDKLPIRWIAPEVVKSHEYTRAADVYAYGILVWEIFSDGENPFGTMTNAQIKEGIQKDDFRPKFPDGTPSDVVETISKCWAGDPKTRLQLDQVKVHFARYKKMGSEDDCPLAGTTGIASSGETAVALQKESKPRKSSKGKAKSKDRIIAKSGRRS